MSIWNLFYLVVSGAAVGLLGFWVARLDKRQMPDLACAIFIFASVVLSNVVAWRLGPEMDSAVNLLLHTVGIGFTAFIWLIYGGRRRLTLPFTYLFAIATDFYFWDRVTGGDNSWATLNRYQIVENVLLLARILVLLGGPLSRAVAIGFESYGRFVLPRRASALRRSDKS